MNRGSLLSLLCALAGPISSFTRNPLVIHSLKLWYQLRSHFKRTELSLIASLHRHCMFPPSLMDEAVIIWTELRVTSMNALFADNIFCSFGQLVSKFKIPQSLFFFLGVFNSSILLFLILIVFRPAHLHLFCTKSLILNQMLSELLMFMSC